MFEQTQWVWMDGEIVAWNDATVHVSSHALHYGTGVFEGIRCYETEDGPAIFRVDAHLERFRASAEVYGLRIPFPPERLTEAMCVLIRLNGFEGCYIRPICYYGSKSLGLMPDRCPVHVAILVWPWNTMHGDEALTKGVHIGVSRWTKFHSAMMPTTAKACGQYINSILALREAVREGFDEALLLDLNGNLSEGAGENLFLVKDGIVLTNDARHSILMGVTREAVIAITRDLGIPVEVRDLRIEELASADEAFFTGTAAEVTPIRALDGKPIGSGRRGPITEKIQQKFFSAVYGREPAYSNWLHRVPVGIAQAGVTELG
ncbi:MAG TPA: branched-chain amino acid transaminase [Terriglobales bacterium]|nr:branched-chain amino acid transaminase [Terriglobales bacterium]